VLSANVFRRNISNYMRAVTTLETVSYATSPRYVLRQQNVGDAVTQGLELEAKFRLSDLWAGGAADRRAHQRQLLPLAREGGARARQPARPAARLHRQLRLDYRFAACRSPSAATSTGRRATRRASRTRRPRASARKLVADVYGLWTFSPTVALRVTASNLAAADYVVGSAIDSHRPAERPPFAKPRRPPRRPTSTCSSGSS
jgi:iron complex outermembrane receptor protein